MQLLFFQIKAKEKLEQKAKKGKKEAGKLLEANMSSQL